MEANVSSSFTRVATKILNATQYTLTNLTVGTTSSGNMITKEEGTMSHRKYFMHFIGGWLLTAIFLFGISFLFITHFLGRREWRKYQERLEEERKAVNHVIVDPKFMKYTKKGWKDIAFSL